MGSRSRVFDLTKRTVIGLAGTGGWVALAVAVAWKLGLPIPGGEALRLLRWP